jgi:poly(A) polymerase
MQRKRIVPKGWMTEDETRAVIKALGKDAARFVGGAVRDTLCGVEVRDIDIATSLTPEQVMDKLKEANIHYVPTGLKHGTITAVINHKPFEITSLRKDINCDGRHAKVEFTTDWKEDASRRDFTMNALYLDIKGNFYDFFEGRDDLKLGVVQFIGEPKERIREDYLRILRLFRFHAWYGRVPIEEHTLKACSQASGKLTGLSAERIQMEMFKLLRAPEPIYAINMMHEADVVAKIFPKTKKLDMAALEKLIALEGKEAFKDVVQDPLVRLLVLLDEDGGKNAARTARAWKLSNVYRDKLIILSDLGKSLKTQPRDENTQKALLRRVGKETFRQLVAYQWAKTEGDDEHFRAMLVLSEKWRAPVFPIRGQDIIQRGIKPGKEIGDILRKLEEEWESGGYKDNRQQLLNKLEEIYLDA